MAKKGDNPRGNTTEGINADRRESELGLESSQGLRNEYTLPARSSERTKGDGSDVVSPSPSTKTIIDHQQQNIKSPASQNPVSPVSASTEAVIPSVSLPVAVTCVSKTSPTSTHTSKDLGTTNTSITKHKETAQEQSSISTENFSPAPLNIAKKTPNTPLLPWPSDKADDSEIIPAVAMPRQRTYSTAISSPSSFSTVELLSGGDPVPGETPRYSSPGAWDSSPPDSNPRIEGSPKSEQSFFLGQSLQEPLSETQSGQIREGSPTGQREQDVEEANSGSNNKPPDKETSEKSSNPTEQPPEGTHCRRESESSSPVDQPSSGNNPTYCPSSRPTFIDEDALDLGLLWDDADNHVGTQSVDSNPLKHNATVLGNTPQKGAGPTQKEIEAKKWLEDIEAKERAATGVKISVEMTEEAKYLQKHITALRNAGTQKVQYNTYCLKH